MHRSKETLATGLLFVIAGLGCVSLGCGSKTVAPDDPAYEGAIFPNPQTAAAENPQ